ncbi:MAG: diadenylate cyclase [Acidimicrobiia bacterium]
MDEPVDPVGDAVAAATAEILGGASVELRYAPDGHALPPAPDGTGIVSASGPGPAGWTMRLTAELDSRGGSLAASDSPMLEVLRVLPAGAVQAAAHFSTIRQPGPDGAPLSPLSPSLQRALRDTIVIEALSRHRAYAADPPGTTELLADTLEYLIELGGTRVESHDLTHGVVISDVLREEPRLRFRYPGDLREAKRAPLLFDGQRSVLVVDKAGRARTELQSHRLDRLTLGTSLLDSLSAEFSHSGSLVAEATQRLGGIGFFLRADRTIWVFADGQPLLMRRGEHWTAFPLELATTIASKTGAHPDTAEIIVGAALIISAQRYGAILAIVDDPDALDPVVAPKDRYDLRDSFDPMAMETETRLHHLINAEHLDAQTLARFASLDGATIVDRDANLIAYGAIVSSSESRFEGARTAAAKTLSQTAEIVLKVSADGDITVFRAGAVVATLLR